MDYQILKYLQENIQAYTDILTQIHITEIEDDLGNANNYLCLVVGEVEQSQKSSCGRVTVKQDLSIKLFSNQDNNDEENDTILKEVEKLLSLVSESEYKSYKNSVIVEKNLSYDPYDTLKKIGNFEHKHIGVVGETNSDVYEVTCSVLYEKAKQ